MTQLDRIANVLRRNSTGPGITAAAIAKAAGVSRRTVYKRVSDLRLVEGLNINTSFRNVNGRRKVYYKFAVK